MTIRSINQSDYQQVAHIYQQGMDTGIATFQNQAPLWEEWDMSHLHHSRLGVFEGEELMGWAALTPVSSRCVYAGVAEVSIYISGESRGKGIGKSLLESLIQESENNGIWTLQSGIFSENIASIKLHEKCGFRMVGYREKIGKKFGVWKDNVLMERRSQLYLYEQ